MRKTIISLPALCACMLSMNAFAIVGSSMHRWEEDRIVAAIEVVNAPSLDDVYGNEYDAENCSLASLSRLLFGDEKIDAYQYKTIKEFAKTITTTNKENGVTTCQFTIPYDEMPETPGMFYYTINSDKTYAFVVKDKNEATQILWSLAQWLMNEKQIDYLLANGAEDILMTYGMPDTDAEKAWRNTESTLCKYVYMGKQKVVKKLLDKGANVNNFCYAGIAPSKDFSKSFVANPLTLSVKRNDIGMLKLLLEYGAEVKNVASLGTENTEMFMDPNPIVEAAKDYEMLSLLLKQKGVDVNQYETLGRTKFSTLMLAIARADPKAVELLISSGADVNKVMVGFEDNKQIVMNGIWALLIPSQVFRISSDTKTNEEDEQKVLEMLIKAGADYNASFDGHTPMSFVKKYFPKFVDVLKKYNAKEDVELLEHNWCTSDYGSRRICGKVKNNTDEEKSVTISFNFYDKDGYRIGNDTAYLRKLEPGSVWKFDNVFPKDGTATYKVMDIQTSLF